MAKVTRRPHSTMIGGQALGRISCHRIGNAPSPRARAACTKSSSSRPERHGAGEAHQDRHVDQADGGDRLEQAGRRHGQHQQAQQHRRQRDQQVDAAHDHFLHGAAMEGGDQAERHADEQADRHGAEAGRQREMRAGQHARQHVAAELIGAEGMQRAGRLQPHAHRKGRGIVGRDPDADDRGDGDDAPARCRPAARVDGMRRRGSASTVMPSLPPRGCAG